jgi:uncharacterized membrane protein HdeD (DUF308 family)
MKLTPNIQRAGRVVRIVLGGVLDILALVLIVRGAMEGDVWRIVVGVFLLLAGSFMIFEGVRSWCIVRAMGVKTPL